MVSYFGVFPFLMTQFLTPVIAPFVPFFYFFVTPYFLYGPLYSIEDLKYSRFTYRTVPSLILLPHFTCVGSTNWYCKALAKMISNALRSRFLPLVVIAVLDLGCLFRLQDLPSPGSTRASNKRHGSPRNSSSSITSGRGGNGSKPEDHQTPQNHEQRQRRDVDGDADVLEMLKYLPKLFFQDLLAHRFVSGFGEFDTLLSSHLFWPPLYTPFGKIGGRRTLQPGSRRRKVTQESDIFFSPPTFCERVHIIKLAFFFEFNLPRAPFQTRCRSSFFVNGRRFDLYLPRALFQTSCR